MDTTGRYSAGNTSEQHRKCAFDEKSNSTVIMFDGLIECINTRYPSTYWEELWTCAGEDQRMRACSEDAAIEYGKRYLCRDTCDLWARELQVGIWPSEGVEVFGCQVLTVQPWTTTRKTIIQTSTCNYCKYQIGCACHIKCNILKEGCPMPKIQSIPCSDNACGYQGYESGESKNRT